MGRSIVYNMGEDGLLDYLLSLRTSEIVTREHRALLRCLSLPKKAEWCTAVLATVQPQPVYLRSPDQAALEILLTILLGPVQDVRAVGGVGRVITVEYNPRPLRVDPATTIACPILGLPGERYELSLRQLLHDPYSMDPKTREARVTDVINEILQAAPGRLTVPELAFAVLGTLHHLAGADGTRWVALLRQWIEEASKAKVGVIEGEVIIIEGLAKPMPPPLVRGKTVDRTNGARS